MIKLFSRLFRIGKVIPPKTPSSHPIHRPKTARPVAKNRVSYSPRPSSPPPKVQVQARPQPSRPPALSINLKFRQKEREIFQRLSALNEKEKYLIEKEKDIDKQKSQTQEKAETLDQLYKKQLEKLENISNLSLDQAKKVIISSTEKKLTAWIAQKITEARETLRQKEEELGKEILVDSIRHGVTDYVAEYTVSTITLPNDSIKGKIIGREGRNIRAFEKATGVELELDESNDIRISSFDSTRREIAKITLQKLIKDGRIQPVKITSLVEQTRNEMDKILVDEGKRICQEVGVYNLPIDLIKQIGKYKFRFSYGQNLAKHTIEVTKIAVAVAQELNADVKVVRLGGLLHDIGKVVTEQEGTHIDLGVNLLRQYKVPQNILDCVAEHHEDKEFSSIESVIVHIGDAASGTRPGARYEVHEEYLKRMQNIEEIAKNFPGVVSVAAYQAGREVMVIVDPGQVNDDQATVLSQNIADKLEEEAKWAGQIKVTVIRELRTSSIVTGNKIKNNAVKKSE
ncbi:ribonuclease Y [Patescibacteria group bacterium]|nr:ribonuclease Y [Patescibacteria group bacterium]